MCFGHHLHQHDVPFLSIVNVVIGNVCALVAMQICGITLRFSFQNKLKNFKVKIREMKCCVTRTDFEIKSTNVWG